MSIVITNSKENYKENIFISCEKLELIIKNIHLIFHIHKIQRPQPKRRKAPFLKLKYYLATRKEFKYFTQINIKRCASILAKRLKLIANLFLFSSNTLQV